MIRARTTTNITHKHDINNKNKGKVNHINDVSDCVYVIVHPRGAS